MVVVITMVEVRDSLDFYKDIKLILQIQEVFQTEKIVYIEGLGREKNV